MKSFTRIEISWIVKLLDEESKRLDVVMADGTTSMEQALAARMRENYQSIQQRLEAVVKDRDKRIEIK